MKRKLLKILIRSLLSLVVISSLFVMLILHPQFVYAKKRSFKQVNVYYQKQYPVSLNQSIENAIVLVSQSALYDSSFRFHLFLNDGRSIAPVLKNVLGDAFAWGYYDNVVLSGELCRNDQFICLNGEQRHLARTIAHEMIHDFQAHYFGWVHSRPLKNIPVWKWEGYAEYVAYKSFIRNERDILVKNIERLHVLEKERDPCADVEIDEGRSYLGLDYLRWWLMIKYLTDIKHMDYVTILNDSIRREDVYPAMLNWYKNSSQ